MNFKGFEELKDFFDSYELANSMLINSYDKFAIHCEIFASRDKNIMQIKLSLKRINQQQSFTFVHHSKILLDLTLNILENTCRMTFDIQDYNKYDDFKKIVQSVSRNYHSLTEVNKKISIKIINPSVSEIKKIFSTVEPYFIKR